MKFFHQLRFRPDVSAGDLVQSIATIIGLLAGLWLGLFQLGKTLSSQDEIALRTYLDEKDSHISEFLFQYPVVSCVYTFGLPGLDIRCESPIKNLEELRSIIIFAEMVVDHVCEVREFMEDGAGYDWHWYSDYVSEIWEDPLGVFRYVTDLYARCGKANGSEAMQYLQVCSNGFPEKLTCEDWIKEGTSELRRSMKT